jgi:hypothetical protein
MREFRRRMTGPKQGVYSVRRANLLIETLRPNPYSPSDSNPSGGRGRFYRLGGLNFGRYSQCLLSVPVGVERHCDSG